MQTHFLRLTCLVLLLCGLHLAAKRRHSSGPPLLTLADVQPYVPKAQALVESSDPSIWEIRDSSDQILALACMTSPQADKIVGYAGPNNVLLIMDTEGKVTQTHWLSWLDTHDHVERVRAADRFWEQFIGRSFGQNNASAIDGVSGATLTSLAIAEAIDLRLSGTRPSLRFPKDITLEEAQALYPDTANIGSDAERPGFTVANDAQGQALGWLWRTGPLVDNKIGYQGPTELLVAIDKDERITKVKVRSSFDNEPYVRYTRMEASFWARFVGKTLNELSQVDLNAEGIEGVSGATMTSMAAAETIRLAAQQHLEELSHRDSEQRPSRPWNWSIGELATAILAMAVVPWSLSRWRGLRWARVAFQILALLIVVGLSGNLLSMALLAGWTRSTPSVALAPGLTLLLLVSLAMPAFFGRNVYCDHVCPHGMLQQWLARWKRSRRTDDITLVQLSTAPPTRRQPDWRRYLQRALKLSAVAILLMSMTWVVWTVPDQLTFFEPFDVYAWRIGWSVSLAVWLASLAWAAQEPMGYCRHACPTGMVLDSIRRKRAGKRWQTSDMLLIALTGGVWLLVII